MFECYTPIVKLSNIEKLFRHKSVFLKLESVHPISHTFKDRGARGVLDQIKKEKKTFVLAATCSNMGVAVSGMAAKYGVKSVILVASSAPVSMIRMIEKFSYVSYVLKGGFDEVDAIVRDISSHYPQIACVNTNYNRYFFEGYFKVMDELVFQLDKDQVYHVVVPTADGTFITALYTRYKELKKQVKIPKIKFTIAQPSGCAPIVHALREKSEIKEWKNSNTSVIPLSVKKPFLYGEQAVKAVKESGGYAMEVEEKEISEYMDLLNSKEGLYSDLVGGVLLGAMHKLSQKISEDEVIIGIYTGNGLIYGGLSNVETLAVENVLDKVGTILKESKNV